MGKAASTAPETGAGDTGDQADANKGADKQPEKAKAPRWVKATARGHYGQLREEGEVFENTLGLPAEKTWFKAAKEPASAED